VIVTLLTPCFPAPYFQTCISKTDLDELNIELIRNALYKVGVSDVGGRALLTVFAGILGGLQPVLPEFG